MVPELQLQRMALEVGLLFQIRLIASPDKVVKECNRHDQGNEPPADKAISIIDDTDRCSSFATWARDSCRSLLARKQIRLSFFIIITYYFNAFWR